MNHYGNDNFMFKGILNFSCHFPLILCGSDRNVECAVGKWCTLHTNRKTSIMSFYRDARTFKHLPEFQQNFKRNLQLCNIACALYGSLVSEPTDFGVFRHSQHIQSYMQCTYQIYDQKLNESRDNPQRFAICNFSHLCYFQFSQTDHSHRWI